MKRLILSSIYPINSHTFYVIEIYYDNQFLGYFKNIKHINKYRYEIICEPELPEVSKSDLHRYKLRLDLNETRRIMENRIARITRNINSTYLYNLPIEVNGMAIYPEDSNKLCMKINSFTIDLEDPSEFHRKYVGQSIRLLVFNKICPDVDSTIKDILIELFQDYLKQNNIHIHHIDEDVRNNSLNNLLLVSNSHHISYHNNKFKLDVNKNAKQLSYALDKNKLKLPERFIDILVQYIQ